VLLLVGSACLFFVGSTIERHHRHHATATAKPATVSGSNSGSETGSESGSTTSGEGTKPAEQHTEPAQGEAGAKILGINTESLALSIVAVVASMLLAVGVWIGVWPRWVLLAVIGFGLVFAAGDIREVIHQANESNDGLAATAATLIVLHLLVSALAAAQRPWQTVLANTPLTGPTA
jgi:hypothetical protein